MNNRSLVIGLAISALAIAGAIIYQPWSSNTGQSQSVQEVINLQDQSQVIESVEQPANDPVTNVEVATQESATDDSMVKVIGLLENIQQTVGNLEKRIDGIDQDMEGLRLDVEQATGANGRPQEPERKNLTEQEVAAQAAAQQAAMDTLFQNIETTINTEYDEGFSQEISSTYDAFVNSGESWTKGVNIKSTDCGGNLCKVVMTYPKTMDPTDQFELDGRFLIEVMSKLPQSIAKERHLPSGEVEQITYFAKTGTELPRVSQ